jgi:hypothetical protein
MTADSVAGWALTAVPPPVQGVNRHAEHLRQVGDRQQSIKLVGHFSPRVLAVQEAASDRELLSTSRILKADRTCLVVTEVSGSPSACNDV